jgi:hypothetical protein
VAAAVGAVPPGVLLVRSPRQTVTEKCVTLSRDEVLDLHSGDAWFISRPRHRGFPHPLQANFDKVLHWTETSSFQIFF